MVGELAGSDGRARSATVRARTPCQLLKIPAPAFRLLLRQRPDILEELYWLQIERVRSLTRLVSKTHQRAITDPLTRLYNFGFFRERLSIEVDRAAQTGDLVSVVMFDIDHFKNYNDNNGHEEGNVALTAVSDMIKSTGRRGDIVARYGGEEFVALLYGATRAEAEAFGETVRQTVEATSLPGGSRQPGGRLTISAGVATFPWDAQTDEALIKAADDNLYKAKEGGRNRSWPGDGAPTRTPRQVMRVLALWSRPGSRRRRDPERVVVSRSARPRASRRRGSGRSAALRPDGDGTLYVGGTRDIPGGKLESGMKDLDRASPGAQAAPHRGDGDRARQRAPPPLPEEGTRAGHAPERRSGGSARELRALAALVTDLARFQHPSLRPYEPTSYAMSAKEGAPARDCRPWTIPEPLADSVFEPRVVRAKGHGDWPTGAIPAAVCLENDKRYVVTFRPLLPGERP